MVVIVDKATGLIKKGAIGEGALYGILYTSEELYDSRKPGLKNFGVEVKDGNLFIEPYTYSDNDAIFTCTADVLFKLISKKLDPIAAFTFKKLKVDGDLGKALKLKEIL